MSVVASRSRSILKLIGFSVITAGMVALIPTLSLWANGLVDAGQGTVTTVIAVGLIAVGIVLYLFGNRREYLARRRISVERPYRR